MAHTGDFENRSDARLRGGAPGDNAATTGRNLPHVIDDLTWAIQCEEKLRLAVSAFDAVQGGAAVNGGLPEQFDNLSKDLQRDIEGFKSGQVRSSYAFRPRPPSSDCLVLPRPKPLTKRSACVLCAVRQFGEWQDALSERLQEFKLDKGSKIIEVACPGLGFGLRGSG